MALKDIIAQNPGFQYVVDQLDLISSTARQQLLQQELLVEAGAIETELDTLSLVVALLQDTDNKEAFVHLRHQFMQLHDLSGTYHNLQHHILLDEIELFEIKQLAHITHHAQQALEKLHFADKIQLPDLDNVFALLDPDKSHIPTFYIYDSYDPRLHPIRQQIKALQAQSDLQNAEVLGELLDQQQAIQQEVVLKLSEQLAPYAQQLSEAQSRLAYCDILIAKALQAIEWQLCRPALSDSHTQYEQLFNPRLLARNRSQNLRYQAVDIALYPGTCIITGANMAGKTVLLKTLAVAQLMAQFGMYVPARQAIVHPVNDIVLCIGDEQNEMNGLSSFASEIIKISQTLTLSATSQNLILIDEPARTTNPTEGQAIVHSIARLLNERNSITLITTHYNQLQVDCRRLRVKGFVENLADQPLTPQTINQFMDYSLLEEKEEQVPHEALRIATLLGCHPDMIQGALDYLSHQQ